MRAANPINVCDYQIGDERFMLFETVGKPDVFEVPKKHRDREVDLRFHPAKNDMQVLTWDNGDPFTEDDLAKGVPPETTFYMAYIDDDGDEEPAVPTYVTIVCSALQKQQDGSYKLVWVTTCKRRDIESRDVTRWMEWTRVAQAAVNRWKEYNKQFEQS